MSTTGTPKNKAKTVVLSTAIVLSIAIVFAAYTVIAALIADDDSKKKRRVHMVQLIKPPPPPKIKEKPPEPEIKKKQEVIEQKPDEPKPEETNDNADDEPPPGDDLGLDAEGTAGGDGFGLSAKKGGRSLIGGKYSEASLLRKYAWYTRIIQDELRKSINSYMDENGGIPEGNLNAVVQITLDDRGRIMDFILSRSTGNTEMDKAVQQVLAAAKISEPPPQNMPRTIKLQISAKG